MDREAEAKLRYDRLRRTLADEGKTRSRARRARLLAIVVLGAGAVIPAYLWEVDLDSVMQDEFFRTPTPHEAYLLSLLETNPPESSRERAWEAWSYRAIDAPLSVGPGYREVGTFPRDDPQALGVQVRIPAGQRLRLTLHVTAARSGRVFLDVFRAAPDSLRHPVALTYPGSLTHPGSLVHPSSPRHPDSLVHPSSLVHPGSLTHPDSLVRRASGWSPRPAFVRSVGLVDLDDDDSWIFEPDRPGDYVLRLQPALEGLARYDLGIQVGARWQFPVAGAAESDIGSLFGDPRDGGTRAHHGVDIFAARGTPVLAAASGTVRSVDTTGIGGRVVWQRESQGRYTLYYAHLDRPLVHEGQRVRAGDTIGLVGNTGNARTTPPHLHFGVYRRGPLDPLDLIVPIPPALPEVRVSMESLGREYRALAAGTRLRDSPLARGNTLAELGGSTHFRVMAGSGEAYRVLLPDGRSGFVDSRFAEPAPTAENEAGEVATRDEGGAK